VYNEVGMVRHTNTEEENSIDVEFHDSTLHHSFRINNIMGHTLAALSTKALVLIPLCDLGSEKSELEEQFWRKQLALSSVPSYKSEEIATLTKEVLAPAVKLFAHSCKSDNDLRAIELCELFSNPQFLQLAFRYATSTGKASLAEKVTNLKSSNNEQDMCRRRSPSPSYQFSG
ncbi:uncharacterized protein LOC103522611, partial [Diaphorina citri]|uniref:Uncharacterized protein LOC103522611 n=1 Tax=Diaphorina citri TaxID=121845 RepID=A0A1S3DQE8_DIACI